MRPDYTSWPGGLFDDRLSHCTAPDDPPEAAEVSAFGFSLIDQGHAFTVEQREEVIPADLLDAVIVFVEQKVDSKMCFIGLGAKDIGHAHGPPAPIFRPLPDQVMIGCALGIARHVGHA